jgi:hypothetical protein
VPALTVVGALAGVYVAVLARRQSPILSVNGAHVAIEEGASVRQLAREQIAAVFTDGRDLVVLDHMEGELARIRAADLPAGRLGGAFQRFGYPWHGTTDPREAEFVRWVDGSPDLDAKTHALLRTRMRALADKRVGAAEDALDELRARGVAVRDRGGAQQYRRTRTARPSH